MSGSQTSPRRLGGVPSPPGFAGPAGCCVTDPDLGIYFRPHGQTVVVGGMEAPGDPLTWLDHADDVAGRVSAETWETQSLRLARRMPGIRIPHRPAGVVGAYDVTDDWIPIYDRTALDGYYVAIGTSGHGFKQAPFVGELLAQLVMACEDGHPHDTEPLRVRGSWTGESVDVGHFSRTRRIVAQTAMG